MASRSEGLLILPPGELTTDDSGNLCPSMLMNLTNTYLSGKSVLRFNSTTIQNNLHSIPVIYQSFFEGKKTNSFSVCTACGSVANSKSFKKAHNRYAITCPLRPPPQNQQHLLLPQHQQYPATFAMLTAPLHTPQEQTNQMHLAGPFGQQVEATCRSRGDSTSSNISFSYLPWSPEEPIISMRLMNIQTDDYIYVPKWLFAICQGQGQVAVASDYLPFGEYILEAEVKYKGQHDRPITGRLLSEWREVMQVGSITNQEDEEYNWNPDDNSSGDDQSEDGGDTDHRSMDYEDSEASTNEHEIYSFPSSNCISNYSNETMEETPTLLAVCIGVNTYSDPTLTPLVSARSDAENMAAIFERGGFTTTTLLDSHATASNVIESLNNMPSKGNEVVVIYYAGHGRRDNDEFRLALHDFHTEDTANTGLTLPRLVTCLFSKRITVILDCCYAELGASQFSTEDKRLDILPSPSDLETNEASLFSLCLQACLNGSLSTEPSEEMNRLFSSKESVRKLREGIGRRFRELYQPSVGEQSAGKNSILVEMPLGLPKDGMATKIITTYTRKNKEKTSPTTTTNHHNNNTTTTTTTTGTTKPKVESNNRLATLESLISRLTESLRLEMKKFESAIGKGGIILLGPTRAGKSTLLDYLMNYGRQLTPKPENPQTAHLQTFPTNPSSETTIGVAVFGVQSSGKSMLINSLTGQTIFPYREAAMTMVPTCVEHRPGQADPKLILPSADKLMVRNMLQHILQTLDVMENYDPNRASLAFLLHAQTAANVVCAIERFQGLCCFSRHVGFFDTQYNVIRKRLDRSIAALQVTHWKTQFAQKFLSEHPVMSKEIVNQLNGVCGDKDYTYLIPHLSRTTSRNLLFPSWKAPNRLHSYHSFHYLLQKTGRESFEDLMKKTQGLMTALAATGLISGNLTRILVNLEGSQMIPQGTTGPEYSDPNAKLFDGVTAVSAFAQMLHKLRPFSPEERVKLMSSIIRVAESPDILTQFESKTDAHSEEERSLTYVHQRYITTGNFLHMYDALLVINEISYPYYHSENRTHRNQFFERLVSLFLGYNHPYLAKERPEAEYYLHPDKLIPFLHARYYSFNRVFKQQQNQGNDNNKDPSSVSRQELDFSKSPLVQAVVSNLQSQDPQVKEDTERTIKNLFSHWKKEADDMVNIELVGYLQKYRYSFEDIMKNREKSKLNLQKKASELKDCLECLEGLQSFFNAHGASLGDDLLSEDKKPRKLTL